jgi:hypothetical protein
MFNPIPQVVQFQYNPDTLTRSLQAQTEGDGGSTSETYRLSGPPKEEISVDIEFDATDKLENPDENEDVKKMGIFPQLSALEMMLYPKSPVVIANTVLAAMGTMEIVPPEGPFTLFIWGAKRVVPVKLTQFNITEEAHDTNLNPIRAKVQIGMKVLTYNDLSVTHPGYAVFLAHQVVKETMASVGTISSMEAIGKGVKIF